MRGLTPEQIARVRAEEGAGRLLTLQFLAGVCSWTALVDALLDGSLPADLEAPIRPLVAVAAMHARAMVRLADALEQANARADP